MTTLVRAESAHLYWSAWRSRLPSYAVVTALGLVLWAFVVDPMLLTVQRSMDGPNAVWRVYASFLDFRPGAIGESVLGSVGLSIASVIAAGLTGTVLAILLQRWDFPLRRVFHALMLIPLALPPFMGVAAFAKLYGLGGTVPTLLGTYLFRSDPNAFALHGIAGALLVHTVTMYPYFYLPVAAALQQTDDTLEDAAHSLGASTLQTWTRVLVPMLTPAIVSGALLTFMSSMGSYTAPSVFAVNKVLTRQIALANDNADLPFASAASVVLALFSIVFLVIFRAYERRTIYSTQSKGGGSRTRRRITHPAWRAVLLAVVSLATAFMMLPILMIVVLAFSVDGSWRESFLPGNYSLQNFFALLHNARSWQPISNSLQMSAIATCGATLVGVCCAYLVGRRRLQGKTAIEISMMLPWALPGTVVAFNLITAFNKPSPFTLGYTLVGTFAIVPLAYFVRFAPLVFRSTTASLSQLDPHLEEAARSLGATWWSAFRRVVLPLLSRGITAGALLVFVSGLGEFVATTLLHAQEKYKPLSIAISEEYYRGNIGTAAAWGFVQMLLVLTVLVVARQVESRNQSFSSM